MLKKSEDDEEYKRYKAYLKSAEWKKIKQAVLERDEFRCRCCGRTVEESPLSIHHSTYDVLFHESEGENLKYIITLCKYCHSGIHKVKSNIHRFRKPTVKN